MYQICDNLVNNCLCKKDNILILLGNFHSAACLTPGVHVLAEANFENHRVSGA